MGVETGRSNRKFVTGNDVSILLDIQLIESPRCAAKTIFAVVEFMKSVVAIAYIVISNEMMTDEFSGAVFHLWPITHLRNESGNKE